MGADAEGRCGVCGGALRGAHVPALRATWGRCSGCGDGCHTRCVEAHDRSRHPEMVADQEALDSVPPPDPADAAAEFDDRSVQVIEAVAGRYWFTGGGVTSLGIGGTAMGLVAGIVSLMRWPSLIGLAITLTFGAA